MSSCSVTCLGQNDLSRAEGRIGLWVKWKRDEQVLKCFRPSCYWNKLINSYFCSDLICIANVKKKSFIGWIVSSLFNTSLIDVELIYLTYLSYILQWGGIYFVSLLCSVVFIRKDLILISYRGSKFLPVGLFVWLFFGLVLIFYLVLNVSI